MVSYQPYAKRVFLSTPILSSGHTHSILDDFKDSGRSIPGE